MWLKVSINKLTNRPKSRNNIFIKEKLLGNKIKVDPIEKPIIEYIVWIENFFINKFITFKKTIPPATKPRLIGISKNKLIVDIASKYNPYTPKHIRIIVLLTPGNTIPIDIKKPATNKYKKLMLEEAKVLMLPSKNIKKIESKSVKIV